jgi:glycerol-3-phosphate dehydrogenase
MKLKTEVLIVGGGATGVGIARDLSLRGIPSVLVEKGDLAAGASGRNHGLLHSGGRYAVSDPEAARECIGENRILKRIAPHCVEETEGLFVSLPEDGTAFQDAFLRGCEKVGISTRFLSRDETLALEPRLNPDLLSAVGVPDGAIDPFTLVVENAKDAKAHGTEFLPHTEATALNLEKNKIARVLARDLLRDEEYWIEASYVVNATGAWAKRLLNLAGIPIQMALSKGSMLITNQRLSQRVINRCRKPADGDIIVPNDTVSILGTTSVRLENVEDFGVTPEEVSLLIQETSRMVPGIKESRLIRAYAGIRPLVQLEAATDDRAITRGFVLIDHEKRDGVKNLVTITGGKFITYRLMAERTCDLLCQKMGLQLPCSTHSTPLPSAHEPAGRIERFKAFSSEKGGTICDCELVPKEEVENVLRSGDVKDIQDILHRTRIAKGTCQGGFCVYRLLGILHELRIATGDSNRDLKHFLEERWKGIRPVLWGVSVKEQELIESIYKGMFNL